MKNTVFCRVSHGHRSTFLLIGNTFYICAYNYIGHFYTVEPLYFGQFRDLVVLYREVSSFQGVNSYNVLVYRKHIWDIAKCP